MPEDLIDEVVQPSETVALEEALSDPAAPMRIVAFEALRRLPLAPDTWRRLSEYAIGCCARATLLRSESP